MRRWDYFTARQALIQCRAIWPWSERVAILSVRAARQLNRIGEAEALIRGYRARHGTLSDSMQVECYLLRRQLGELDDVMPFVQKYVEDGGPDAPAVLDTISALYFEVGDMQKGFTCLTHWLELEPNSVIALDRRALAHEQANNPDAAKKDYERILQLQPDLHNARRRLVSLYLPDRRIEEAQAIAEDLTRLEPDNLDNWVLLAQCYFEANNLETAAKLLDRVLEQDPDMVLALYFRGSVATRAEDLAKATRCLERAAELAPAASFILEKWYRSLAAQNDPRAPDVFKRLENRRRLEDQLNEIKKKETRRIALSLEEQLQAAEIYLKVNGTLEGQYRLGQILRRTRITRGRTN